MNSTLQHYPSTSLDPQTTSTTYNHYIISRALSCRVQSEDEPDEEPDEEPDDVDGSGQYADLLLPWSSALITICVYFRAAADEAAVDLLA